MLASTASLHLDTMVGTSFAQYRILEKIGRGGMGEVFLAEDTNLQRKVALKFLPDALAQSVESRERFLVEARAAAALSHPNICVIHEVGEAHLRDDREDLADGPSGETEAEGGRPFIAMEYVEGETLREKVREGSLSLDRITSILQQVLAGLQEAHEKGIVHRDIKSNNIMVTPQGRAKILDFGLAKVQGGPALTKTMTTLGTVAYMSPEQAAGDPVDPRSDLWSVGVVLYEMLSGQLPFRGDRETVVLHHILHEAPEPMEDLKPPIPLALRRMVKRALKKDPNLRYASATEMLGDLQQYQDGLAAEAAGVFNVRSLGRRLRRPRVAVPTALVGLALVALAYWYAERRADIRWAREEAMPRIQEMVRSNDVWRDLVEPYRLAEAVEEVLPGDDQLAQLLETLSREIDVLTDPDGATVYIKEYSKPDTAWRLLGVTPLEDIRMPIGVFRWRMVKEGFDTVLAASSTWNADLTDPRIVTGYDVTRTMDPAGTIPQGMVRVPGAITPIGEIGDFFLDRLEVTNREFKTFLDAGGYGNPEYWTHEFMVGGRALSWEEGIRRFVDRTGLPGPAGWEGGSFPPGQGDYPVSGVSWYEAAAYAEFVGKTLPTDAHWQVASGAFTPMVQFPQLGGLALFAPFSNFNSSGPVPVGSQPSLTAFGNLDMPGNVREWCWNETPNGRVIRGGSWEDNPYMFGAQSQAPALDRSLTNGIRLARYPDPEDLPEAVFQPQFPPEMRNFYAEEPVPEAVFEVYKEQFSYDPSPLNAETELREESPEGWILERVTFDAAYGQERVTGYLHLPTVAEPPYSVVVYFPGSQALFAGERENLEEWDEFITFVSFLPAAGRAVFYPTYQGTFHRGDPAMAALHGGNDTRAYSDFLVQAVQDFMRSVDYLETRPDIDTERLAYYGMSWGGALGGIVPAVEDRIDAVILLAGGFRPLEARRPRPEADPRNYVERIRKPTLMLNGRYDALFGLENGIRPFYELLGTPEEDKELLLYETDHIPPRAEFIREILAWLDEYLGPVER